MYRRAEQLDPGVYTHMRDVPIEYQQEKQKQFRVFEDFPDENENLVENFEALSLGDGCSIDCQGAKIEKSYSTQKHHISDLPTEMLYQVARAVIGPNLSRGFS